MRWTWPLVFGVLAILTLICISSPVLVLYGFFFFILPGLAMVAAPPALFYLSVAAVAVMLVPRAPIAAALVAVAVVGTFPAWLVNQPLRIAAARLRASDFEGVSALPTARTIAMLLPPAVMANDGFAGSTCHQYCQRLLFGGEAERVLVEVPPPAGPLNTEMILASYRLETRKTCPPAPIPNSNSWETTGDEDLGDAGLLKTSVMSAVARGRCIIWGSGRLGEADLVIVDRPVVLPEAEKGEERLLYAKRVQVFQKGVQGLRPVLQRTQVNTRPLMLPWIWTRMHFGTNNSGLGPIRDEKTNGQYTLSQVMRNKLSLKLQLPTDALPSSVPSRTLILQGLDDVYAIGGDPRLKLIKQYLCGLSEKGTYDSADLETIARIITDERADAEELFCLTAAIRKLGPSSAILGKPLFNRLEQTEMPIGYNEVMIIARGIQALPRTAIVQHMARLRRLADDGLRRDRAWPALTRLTEGGVSELPTIARLLTDASGPRRGEASIGALIALCNLGLEGRSLGEVIEERVRAAHLRGSMPELEWITLQRQGRAAMLRQRLSLGDDEARIVEQARTRASQPKACDSVWV